MSVREYIGARYVPIFGREGDESIQWDNTLEYEPLTIVLYQGNSYTSRQWVPVGIDITNEQFWAQTGNYNAQVEAYRQEVRAFDGRITANADAIDDLSDTIGDGFDTTHTVEDAIDNLNDTIGDAFSPENTVEEAISTTNATIGNAFDPAHTVQDRINLTETAVTNIEGDISDINSTIANMDTGTFSTFFNIYVDGTNGDDTNDGLTEETPLQTIDAAIDLANTANSSTCNIVILSAGTYNTDLHYVINGQFHMGKKQTVLGDVIVNFDSYFTCYNSYVNFSYITVNVPNGMHVDGTAFYSTNVTFNVATRFDFYECNFWHVNCTMKTEVSLTIGQCIGRFHNFTYENTGDVNGISINTSLIVIAGLTIKAHNNGADYLFNILDSMVTLYGTTSKTGSASYRYLIRATRSFLASETGVLSALASLADNEFIGYYTVFNKKSAATIFE